MSNDYLCNAVLYHELGHFIDQVQNIYPPIKSILWANKDKVDCQKYFPYISDSRYPEPYRQAILQNHIKEYFADIFAAQYIRESSFYYLEYIAGKMGYLKLTLRHLTEFCLLKNSYLITISLDLYSIHSFEK